MRHLGISDGNLEEGSFRCDVNISLRKVGETKLGTRCEIKNLNSFKNVERAIRYEIVRQADLLDAGHQIKQNTLLFDASSGKTGVMRSKEDSQDYRYFPDPDLRAVYIDKNRIDRARAQLPELPEAIAIRFSSSFGLAKADASFLAADRDLARYFEKAVLNAGDLVSPKIVANWVMTEFMREANAREWDLGAPPLKAESLGDLLKYIGSGTLSGRMAKEVFEEMVETGHAPATIVVSKNLQQVSDRQSVITVIKAVLERSPGQVAEFHAGKDKVFGYLVGQIMKDAQGKLNPGIVNEVLKDLLAGLKP